MSSRTFLRQRKQRPLKSIQALAPGFVLCFDLAGIPYQEPAFSSIRKRIDDEDPDVIGIAYLLTRPEYERLLQSEGGRNGGYMEIDVEVKPLLDLTTEKERIICKSLETREPRDNPHPLPSARYLSLIRNGAAEHKFPAEYQEYLDNLSTYTITTWRTEIGRILFLLICLPIVLFVFTLMTLKDKHGELPRWVIRFQLMVYKTIWSLHDNYFSPIFGPGDINQKEETDNALCEKCFNQV